MSDDRDLELGVALRGLPTPEHDPGFWAELEDRLAGEAALPEVTRLRTRRFVPRSMWLLSAAAVVVMVAAAVAVLRPDGTTRLRVTPPAVTPEKATWTPLADSPLSLRSGHTAVWTGRQMLVWGGNGPDSAPLADGAAYDPSTDRWTAMTDSPTGPLFGHTAVWTGSRMLVLGGAAVAPGDPDRAAGAAYDPTTDTWTTISRSPLKTVAGQAAVWTGDRMLAWGGSVGESPLAEGASYDPLSDRWTRMAAAPLAPRYDHTAVWTGTRMIVWGGYSGEESPSREAFADGAAYDPATDSWTTLPASPLAGRAMQVAVWTGSAMVIWGGSTSTSGLVADGASYDPKSSSWQMLPASPLTPRLFQSGIAAGGRVLVWGGDGTEGGRALADGAAYDPVARVWRTLPEGPLQPRSRHAAVWTGAAMIVTGGADAQAHRSDGAALRPSP